MPMTERMTSAEWVTDIKEPVTAAAALAQMDKAIAYADAVIDSVMGMYSGTMPPARALMPDLYTALDNAKRARDGVAVVAEKAPDSTLQPMYVIAGRNLGVKLIDTANATLTRAEKTPKLDKLPSLPNLLPNVLPKLPTPVIFWGGLGLLAWLMTSKRKKVW